MGQPPRRCAIRASVWPAWPNHVRVTIGTQEEMDKFKTALVKVMA